MITHLGLYSNWKCDTIINVKEFNLKIKIKSWKNLHLGLYSDSECGIIINVKSSTKKK